VQVPVVNDSEYIANTDVVFICEGVQDSLKACADAWDERSDAVLFYSSPPYLNGTGIGHVATIVDDMTEAPGAEAYHSVDANGVVFSRILAGLGADVDVVSVGLDHELKESLIDPDCTDVVKMPDGRLLAREVCDPVQGDVKKVVVVIGKITRTMAISNFCLPAYFEAGAPGPYDAFGLVSRPFECRPGGYQEVMDPVTGEVSYVFADQADQIDEAGRAALAARQQNPSSRLNRRAAKREEALKAARKRLDVP
jgi:hypothetical protein